MKQLVVSAILLAALATPAAAKEFPIGRIEANVGWDHVRGKLSYRDSAFPADNFSGSRNTDGVVYGATVGVDVPMSGLYLGLEGSVDLADNKRCLPVFGDDSACFKVKRNFAAGGRVGVPLGTRALYYVGAAYVNGKARASYTDDLDPSNNIAASDSRDGYRISTGAEVRLQGKMFTKLEYRYSDYGDYDLASGTQRASVGITRHQVVGGIGVRF